MTTAGATTEKRRPSVATGVPPPAAAAAPATRRSPRVASLDRLVALRRRVAAGLAALFAWLYQRTVVELLLRRNHVAASHDGRRIPLRVEHASPLIDPRRGYSYLSNDIRTSRYTVWDFVPKQLFFQFSRVGNFYFLCVGIPQMIPGLSTTGTYTTILPLLFFVLITIAKEGFDDYRRYRLDKVENANFATVLGREDRYTGSKQAEYPWHRWNPFRTKKPTEPRPLPDDEFQGVRWVPTRWSDIRVGDVLHLDRDEPVPADVVLLHSAGENGLAYIETMALDGETSLKSRQVCHALDGCGTISGIARCRADFVVEDPNPDLYSFDGRVAVDGKTVPLTVNEVLYRGSILRNTSSAVGLVINTGEECKIRMNANRHPKAKKPALERVNNMIVVTLATYVVLLSVGVSMGYVRWQRRYERNAWYIDNAAVPFYQIIIAFIIMFNNVVPLSLYISLEIVKVGQLLNVNSDIGMYDQETDTPARCNTNTILENLGQVGYIFSDKTGTLTDNIMKFRKISVAGTVWLHEMDLEPAHAAARDCESDADDASSTDESVRKPQPLAFVVPERTERRSQPPPAAPVSPSRPSIGGRSSVGRRSSSHWRSTGRPDHVQPEVNTADLLEYVRLRPHCAFSRKARDYLLAVALCHTCLPEVRDGKVEFQASSPDELALVKAARELGYVVLGRTSQSITLRIDGEDSGEGEPQTFQILDVIEFSSSRKRMSVVVRYPDGRISVICKGADSAILPRLKMSSLAMQKATEARQSADLEHDRLRRSEHRDLRRSHGDRNSFTIRRSLGVSAEHGRPEMSRSTSFEASRLLRRSLDHSALAASPRGLSFDGRRGQSPYLAARLAKSPGPVPDRFAFLEDRAYLSESDVFAKCFQHLEEFASEGLRTLLYAQRFMSEADYATWKKAYDEATTSLVDRQERIEEVGDMIEQSFDLVGATAIEDKLQKGVPETIDRLRRAHIKIWMLTGDKRETAINIAHSARICRPGSDLYVLDVTKGDLESQLSTLGEDLQAGSPHSVVVVDGATLGAVEKSAELSGLFFSVIVLVDSVICCRASPAQKALLVRTVRSRLRGLKRGQKRGLTLAIGDGANDLAMISASHVGVGISGKEGLQAARVADYSIAQFRFLQRLLLVHGRWNYVRTAKFILCTFWKEMFFYLPTAQYQRYNGYTGTSLYEATSLTVFNTLFTSLCTICMGIWEQDLQPETLLAIPELYVHGQRGKGLNLWNYTRWMAHAACQGVIAWYGVWAGYGWIVPSARDTGLYAIGQLAFSAGVLWINWKLFIFETHHKTSIVMGSFFLTTIGWWAWCSFLDGVFAPSPSGPYAIRDGFTTRFGRDPVWWATLFIVLALLGIMDIALKIARRNLRLSGLLRWRPSWRGRLPGLRGGSARDEEREDGEDVVADTELWQELEQDPAIFERLKRLARDGDGDDEDDEDVDYDGEDDGQLDDPPVTDVSSGGKSWLAGPVAKLKHAMVRVRS